MTQKPQFMSMNWLFVWVVLLCAAGLLQGTALASTADHSQFKGLLQDFKSGSAVTKVCLECHAKAADEVMASKHWSWEWPDPHSKKMLGKQNVLTSFSLGIQSNNPVCSACHVGYGWKDNNFDFTAQENVNCLVCHDTTGAYRKQSGMAGHPPVVAMEFPPGSGNVSQTRRSEGSCPECGQVQPRQLWCLPLSRRRRRWRETWRSG